MPPDPAQSPRPGETRSRAGRRIPATAAALAAALAVAVGVTAFGGLRVPDSDEGTLRGFQIRVLSITQAAAENRMDGALAALQALETDLDSAARDGRISAPRLRGIETALEAVRANIAGQMASQAPAAGTAPVEDTPAAAGTSGAAPAEATVPQSQPIQPVAEEPAPLPQPVPVPVQQEEQLPDAAKEARGKGKGQGKP
ncbi:hypothetical protein [Pseudarthrobacter sp. NS4]|uniref:hypothetical protein n=1 Tax=Pseudarthrobacter sp. NS4 TaxID=2973976 RepID=UPI002161B5AE|nr:hypothetical protein [Pseudarthrobacter sp. NS4]